MEFQTLLLLEDYAPRAAALQMAIDQALLQTACLPILRVYRWAQRCITIGYFESYKIAQTDSPNLEIVRRWTGGGSVLHGEDWPYSLIVPATDPFAKIRPAESYQLIHNALAHCLSQNSSEVQLAQANADKLSAACFENPVQHDILLGDKKIAGAGQRRNKSGLLHQGSVQLLKSAHPTANEFAKALSKSIIGFELSPDALEIAQVIAAQRYQTPEWNEAR